MITSVNSAVRTAFSLILAFTLIILWTPNANAWRILSAEHIPAGSVAMTPGPQGLWCGYEIEGDSILRVIDPDNGRIITTYAPPEAQCRGIGLYSGSIWFLGDQQLYCLGRDGRVTDQLDPPYEQMSGLVGTEDGFWTVVYDNGRFSLTLFEPGGEEARTFLTTLQHVGDISWDGEFLWVTDPIGGFIHRFNSVSEQEVAIFPTPTSEPGAIAYLDNQLSLIDEGLDEENQILYRIDPEGEPAPRLLPSAEHHDFGLVQVFTNFRWDIALYNIGGQELEVDTVHLVSGESGFRLGQMPGNINIQPDRWVMLQLYFAPNQYGYYTDTLMIVTNDPNNPNRRVSLTGLGIMPSRRLEVYPEMLDFGVVRADPWRDGNRLRRLALINVGIEDLRIDSLNNYIEEIFTFEQPDLPVTVTAAESLMVDFWFTPHRGIQYIDTLLIYSNHHANMAIEVVMRGQGSDSVYSAGTVMWQHHLEEGGQGMGSVARQNDINRDDIDDVVAVGPSGSVYCLNGFASDEADIIWQQDFGGAPYRPVGIAANGCLASGSDLNGDGCGDVIFGSGRDDRSVYGLDGADGRLIWRWDSRSVNGEGAVIRVSADNDRNGDGSVDPVVLIDAPEGGSSRVVRIDGATGSSVWVRNVPPATLIEPVDDLDHDGVLEYAISAAEILRVYGGYNGSLMHIIETGAISSLQLVGDLNEDQANDIIVALVGGGLEAWSILDEQQLWHIDRLTDEIELAEVLFIADYGADLNDDDIDELAGSDANGSLFLINPIQGECLWVDQTGREIYSLAIQSEFNNDPHPKLLVGYENGRIESRNGLDGELFWSFSGEQAGWQGAYHLFGFSDIDLGGSLDLVGLFGDRTVRCISSGGDLSIQPSSSNPVPFDPAFNSVYPNPFNGPVEIVFSLVNPASITLEIWNINGRRVDLRILGKYGSGTHRLHFDPNDNGLFSNGVYLFRLRGENYSSIYEGILLK